MVNFLKNPWDKIKEAGRGTNKGFNQLKDNPTKVIKNAGNDIQNNITTPIVTTVKKAGRDYGKFIDTAIVDPMKDHLKDPIGATKKDFKSFDDEVLHPIGEEIKKGVNSVGESVAGAFNSIAGGTPTNGTPTVTDTSKNAMRDYAGNVNKQSQTFNPANYGEGAYRARTMQPQVTQTAGQPQVTRTPQMTTQAGQAAPQQAQINNNGPQPQIPQAQTVSKTFSANAPQLNNVYGSRMQGAQTMGQINPMSAGTPNTPQLNSNLNQQMVNPNALDLQSVSGIDPNVANNRSIIQQQIQSAGNSQPMQEGFGSDYVQKMTDMSNRRLDTQQANMLQNMKESQGSAGNLGSSVAQKQIADMMMEYDARKSDNADQAYMTQENAMRDDRYKNANLGMANTSQIQSLVGSDYNMGMGSADFNRSGVQADNSNAVTGASFNRSGTQINNDTQSQMARYGNDIAQQNYGNQVNRNNTDFGRATDINAINNASKQQDFQNATNVNNTNYNRNINETGINNSTAQQNFQNQQNVNSTNFNNDLTAKTFNNQAGQQNYNNAVNANDSQFNRDQTVAGFNNNVNQQDFLNNNAVDQQNFQNKLTTNQFNAGRNDTEFAQGQQNYQNNVSQGRYNDSVVNSGQQFNINQRDNAEANNINNFNNSQNDLMNLGQMNQFDPQQMMDYNIWKEQQANKARMVGAGVGMLGDMMS